MEPIQQQPSQNPYEFITSPSAPQKKPLLGGSLVGRVLMVVGVIVVLTIVGSILMSVLGGSGDSTTAIKNLIAEQQEIIRVADLGVENAQASDTRAFASNVSLTLRTDQIKIEQLLTAAKGKITPIERVAKKSSATDSSLEAASSTNKYDEVVREILQTRLTAYLASLKSAYDAASGEKTKAQLSASYTSTETILGISKDSSN